MLRIALFSLCLAAAMPVAARAAQSQPTPAAATSDAASPAPVPSSAGAPTISELKAQMDALRARLDLLESQQSQQAAMALADRTKAAEVAAAKAKQPAGAGVHIIETQGTDVRLYGLIEPTFSVTGNATPTNGTSIGIPVSWFSGNRWGLDIKQNLSSTPDNPNDLALIARLESEFELASGNMDTPGVLFNRDAWLGIQSPDFGKLTIGRQDTLPRDVSGNYGDPYGVAELTTNEGNYTNVNDFKQLIFYTSGGNGAGGQGDTRYDAGVVYKKITPGGVFLAAAYNVGDANGPGGPNGSGPIPGAQLDKGSSAAFGLGLNRGGFHGSVFYNTTNVLEVPTIGTTNVGHQDQSVGIGGNYDWGVFRLNAGFIDYSGDQGALGHRNDTVWTTSAKLTPNKHIDYELGVQEFYSANAAVNAAGFVTRPYTDPTGLKSTIYGDRFTIYGSAITHPMPNVDVYLAGDNLLTGGGYLDARANGSKHQIETATGLRYKF